MNRTLQPSNLLLNIDSSSSRADTFNLDTFEQPVRHPDLSFDDGNIAIRTGRYYFLVHQGLLSRHAKLFPDLPQIPTDSTRSIEGRAVVPLHDSPDDMVQFLRALYDGTSGLRYNANDFSLVASILRLATKYHADRLRATLIEQLSIGWPNTLPMWEHRERLATNSAGLYSPRPTFPHPILVIKLAREVHAPQLLPSALYDLSRYMPSQIVAGYTSPDFTHHEISTEDIVMTFKGREAAARFFSTFIVTALESRDASEWCSNRTAECSEKRRACRVAFEAITFELLRDVNGLICNRNSDPLYAITESHGMQTRNDVARTENMLAHRPCEACRLELASVVDTAREEFWMMLPAWFQIEVLKWGGS